MVLGANGIRPTIQFYFLMLSISLLNMFSMFMRDVHVTVKFSTTNQSAQYRYSIEHLVNKLGLVV